MEKEIKSRQRRLMKTLPYAKILLGCLDGFIEKYPYRLTKRQVNYFRKVIIIHWLVEGLPTQRVFDLWLRDRHWTYTNYTTAAIRRHMYLNGIDIDLMHFKGNPLTYPFVLSLDVSKDHTDWVLKHLKNEKNVRYVKMLLKTTPA